MNQFMASLRVLFAVFILIGLASRSIGQGKDEKQYEAKLLHKLPLETHGFPALKETKAGLTLVVPMRLQKSGGEALSIWNVPANKENQRISDVTKLKVKSGLTFLDPPFRNADRGPWLAGEITPDGKKLAMPVKHAARPNGAGGTAVALHEFGTDTVTVLPTLYDATSGLQLMFLPNGELIVVTEGPNISPMVVIQKIGAAKPRVTFKVPTRMVGPHFHMWRNTAELASDGTRLAVCYLGIVSVFDTTNGKLMLQLPRGVAGTPSFSGLWTVSTSMVFVGDANNPKLLAVDHEPDAKKDILIARMIDRKTKKVISEKTLVETANEKGLFQGRPWAREGFPFVDEKSQPRVLYNGKIYDPATGYVLGEFDPGLGASISRDGKYIVRLTSVEDDKNKKGIEIWSLSIVQK